MATVDEIEPKPLASSRVSASFQWFEEVLSRWGELLNPILVKESRQALKSRQFMITFILVLLAGWTWSIVGIAWIGPGVYWSADGPSMFFGYYIILAFPLLVIVPYGAYRSLASEREDRTYELLSITTLRPRQVIAGKLAGAVLQMVVYLSAISPCLAFTYLLRGLDILTIAMIVFYLFLGSLGLSMLSLLLATGTSEKYQQVILSVAIVFGLGMAFFSSCGITGEMLTWSAAFDDEEFWIVNAALLTGYLSYFALFFLAATAQISFANSNRSTPLRIAALVQQALFLGWMGGLWFENEIDYEGYAVIALFSGLHWFVMGVFMVGESGTLSPRVRRDLPQSFLGRAFLTWLNPGPGTGYLLALSSYLGVLVMILIGILTGRSTGRHTLDFDRLVLMSGLGMSYLAIYLGISRLILRAIGKFSAATVALRVLIPIFMVLVGTLVPVTIQFSIPALRSEDYLALQASNPFWTLSEVFSMSPATNIWSTLMILLITGIVVFAINLPSVAEEVRQLRIQPPKRVIEDDGEIDAKAQADGEAEGGKTSPWD
jgi:hypothetical protein